MGQTAVSIGANVFQFFTRNPRGGAAKPLDKADVKAFLAYAGEHGIGPILAHAPYTLNAAAAEPRIREFAESVFIDDLKRLEHTPGALYNFHPGSHVGQGVGTGVAQIAGILDEVLRPEQSTTVLLETMSGKGSEVGGRFEEIRAILDRTALGARKDRHARIGEGCIGLEALVRVVNHPLLRDLPFYLETPNDLDGYRDEIALLSAHRR